MAFEGDGSATGAAEARAMAWTEVVAVAARRMSCVSCISGSGLSVVVSSYSSLLMGSCGESQTDLWLNDVCIIIRGMRHHLAIWRAPYICWDEERRPIEAPIGNNRQRTIMLPDIVTCY